MKPTVSIILVNYRTVKQTRLCLRSLRKFTRYPAETIVVDNRSEDASAEYLRSLKWIRLLENEAPEPTHRNGIDLAIRCSGSEVIVAMHTDTFVRRQGWLETLLSYLDSRTMLVGSAERVVLADGWLDRLDAWRKRRRRERQWKRTGNPPKCNTHCILYRRELFTTYGQRFDDPAWVDGVYVDAGELIQRFCEENSLGVRYLDHEQLAPLFSHFEAATLNRVTGRSLALKRRWRSWRFYRRDDVQAILADESLDR